MPSSVPIHSLEIGTSCCATCTTSTSGRSTAWAISLAFEGRVATRSAATSPPSSAQTISLCFHSACMFISSNRPITSRGVSRHDPEIHGGILRPCRAPISIIPGHTGPRQLCVGLPHPTYVSWVCHPSCASVGIRQRSHHRNGWDVHAFQLPPCQPCGVVLDE